VPVLRRGERPEAAIYLHPAESGRGLDEVKAVTPGLLRFRIRVSGRAPDTSEPEQTPFVHQAVNPAERAWTIVRALTAVGERRAARVRHPALEAAIGRSTNLHLASVLCGAGDRLGRVADACELAGTVTFPPGEPMEDVQREIAHAIEAAAADDAWLAAHRPDLTWLAGIRGAEVSPDTPLLRMVQDAVEAVTGRRPRVNALHASSDIAHPILAAGIPAVGLGPRAGAPDAARGLPDWVDVSEHVQTVEILRRLIVSEEAAG
jgi:acetylornithine deacetylase